MALLPLLVGLAMRAAALRSPGRRLHARRAPSMALDIRDSVDLLFVGGKGGVGKTSVSAAIGFEWSARGARTLLVSTDPAHSLGDALGVRLSGAPTRVGDNLDAVEVDADAAMANWRRAVEAFDAEAFGARYGPLGVEAVRSLGLDEFVELLASPPPGIDELVALADVVKYARDENYDRVVVDTAPTGHALRLLDLPQFADGLVGKLVGLRDRVGSLAKLAGGVLGASNPLAGAAGDVDAVAAKLETLKAGLDGVRDALRDSERTEFVAVAIPTELAYAETRRLATKLAGATQGGGVGLRTIVVNRCLDGFEVGAARTLAEKHRANVDLAFSRNPLAAAAKVEVPALHTGSELGGVFGLKYFGSRAFEGDAAAAALDGIFAQREAKLVVCGGKGGVGKTTVSSALGVALADRGFDTLVISTDPAHSLGDCLAVDLSGGAVVEVDSPSEGRLFALEVDADAAALEAAALLKEGLGEKLRSLGDAGAAAADLADALETSPPGLDELVSLLKVLELIRSKQYDRIVLDTAPTGHTLRLLALPELMDDFAERSMNARDRLKRNPVVAAALAGAGFSGGGGESGGRDAVRDVQDDAFAMDAILHDEASCEFLAVAAPTDLSLTETANLLDSLDEAGIACRAVVVNGVLDGGDDAGLAAFSAAAETTQAAALAELHALADELRVDLVRTPQFDGDLPAGAAGLAKLGDALFRC